MLLFSPRPTFCCVPHDKPVRVQETGDSEQRAGNLTPNSQPRTPTPLNPQPRRPSAGKDTTLNLLGAIIAGAQEQVSVRQPARIVGVYVKEGQAVQAGQLLVQLDTAEVQAGEKTAQANIRTAQAQADRARSEREAQLVKADADITTAQEAFARAQSQLKQAHLGVQAARQSDQAELLAAQTAVRKAETGVKTAQTQLHSLEELAKVGGVARNDLEGARTQAQIAQTDLDSAQQAVRRIQAGPPEQPGVSFRVANALQEETQAQTGVTQAQSGLKTAQSARIQINKTANAGIRAAEASVAQARTGLSTAQIGDQVARLTSHISGVATSISARIGETAQPGMPLLTVVSSSGARIEALVPSRQLALVHIGQSAQITLDASPGKSFAALVSAIASVAEPDGRAFRVTFHFVSSTSGLRIGQAARIEIRE